MDCNTCVFIGSGACDVRPMESLLPEQHDSHVNTLSDFYASLRPDDCNEQSGEIPQGEDED